jgi:hypothetical protein
MAIGDYSAFALAILATPWIVVTVLAAHMYQREAKDARPSGSLWSEEGAGSRRRSSLVIVRTEDLRKELASLHLERGS